jgi:transcriptional regulator with XRE-family HTH domain
MESLAKRLQRLRKAKAVSASQMAKRLAVAETTYREWEQERQIRGEPYMKLAEILGVSLSELMTGEQSSQRIAESLKQIEEAVRCIRKHF